MSDIRVVSFNVNQFSPTAHQRTDLIDRMVDADVVLVQESVKLDLGLFAASQPGWSVFQIRHGDNDGHANTAVLFRSTLGPVEDTVDLFVGFTKGTRRRFLAAVKLGGVWYWSMHLFPRRFRRGIPKQLRRAGRWIKAHPGVHVGGLDKNQAKASDLEKATSLTWHGIDIDGFLTSAPLKGLVEFPKGFSDHPGVHAVVTPTGTHDEGKPVTKPTWLQSIRASLRKALAHFKSTGQKRKAKKAQSALDQLGPQKPKPKPQPVPPKPEPTAPRGFMPGAILKPISAGSNDPAIIPCGVIQHIAVSNSDSLFGLFSNDGGIESHFYIRKDGTIEQYRSIFFEADANADGNSFGSPRRGFVSVEHEGGVGADLNQPMPKVQLDAFHSVVLWVKSQADFPLRVTPAWNQPGVGYHALFKEWNPNSHSCPGAARIKQFHDATVPWLKSGGKS